ncbi:MAG: DUF1071 domain-containing protein [Clostridia bacterium]|nr:DUF1071 domain-containing protein [Clostridia bacterium]MBR2735369.1 DUF1071 domain-containing protein [Clostridia bacterium]
MPKEKSVFETLFNLNVNKHIEQKNGLSYLSWPYAWAEVKKHYPDANYEIKLFGENNLPYIFDENTGYMVFTSVTIKSVTHEMWLPVMDNANKTMKSVKYVYETRYKKNVPVETATMFDINKTIMRCLVKNLAMFGLGLYIYAGEDLPEIENETISTVNAKYLSEMVNSFENAERLKLNILNNYHVSNFSELNIVQYHEILNKLNEWSNSSGKAK